jgi:uncharacterized protein YaaQ
MHNWNHRSPQARRCMVQQSPRAAKVALRAAGCQTLVMKLVLAIVHPDDAGGMVDALLKQSYRATRLQSSGGFLKKSNATLLVGVEDAQVDDVISVIRANSRSRTQPVDHLARDSAAAPTVDLKAAVVFVVPVDGFDRV